MNRDLQEFHSSLALLYSKCKTEEEYQSLRAFLREIDKDSSKYGCADLTEPLMNIPIYNGIAESLKWRAKDTVIIDCGCGNALQQILFNDFKLYIGIDALDHFEAISPNTVLHHGTIEEELECIDIDDSVIGISVFCASCFENIRKEMEIFNRVIII